MDDPLTPMTAKITDISGLVVAAFNRVNCSMSVLFN